MVPDKKGQERTIELSLTSVRERVIIRVKIPNTPHLLMGALIDLTRICRITNTSPKDENFPKK